MTIDSLKYSGLCSCGEEHEMQTIFCEVSNGCLKDFDKYILKYDLKGYMVAVYDQNTYLATEDRRPSADKEVVLDPTDLHANEIGVDNLLKNLPNEAEVLVAIGSGTIHDLTRYCAYVRGCEFVSCPTAASVDGFCSSVAAMTWNGYKKTLTAVAPKLVIADIDIIKNAPSRLTRSGFGDMIGKYIALTDWKISSMLTKEFYCARIANLTLNATESVLNSVDGIMKGEDEAYEKLTYGLLLSGIAMQMMKNSRPASGSEHHVSHFIEIEPKSLAIKSSALHGEKVGVGTLMALREYKRMASIKNPTFIDYLPYSNEVVENIFGKNLAIEILNENKNDCATKVKGKDIENLWADICNVLSNLPDPKYLLEVYLSFNAKKNLEDIEVSEEYASQLLEYSHLVRNRLTLMRLRKCIKG